MQNLGGSNLEGVIYSIYPEIKLSFIKDDDNVIHKVPLHRLTLLEKKTEDPIEESIIITPTEFKTITRDLINLIQDPHFKEGLRLYSEALFLRLFGTEPEK